MDCFGYRIIDWFAFFSKIVYFSRNIGTMRTHHGSECAKLKPANIQFLK